MTNRLIGNAVVLLVLAAASATSARGGYHHSQAAAPACGFVSGALADPADTQRCLAERYKAPKPKSSATSAQPPSSNSAPSSDSAPPSNQGD